MRTYVHPIAAALLLLITAILPIAAAQRVALVIGNSAYTQAPPLTNPSHDASDIAKILEQFDFEVTLGVDLDRHAFEQKIRAFSYALESADAAVLFYAGHGLQVSGHNYLIPVDASLKSERDLDFEAIQLDFVLKQMEVGREGKTNIVFLDACRDNPLARNLARSMGTRSASVGKGLAEVQIGVGTFIAYSTQPGNVSLDGEGRNSPFATALSRHLPEQGRNITAIMIDVRKDVLAMTNGQQVPWDHSALTADFFLQPAVLKSDAPPASSASAGLNPAQLAAELDALAGAGNWRELHDRLGEVSPLSRDDHWSKLVEKAALGELAPLTEPGLPAMERLAAIDRYYPKFPSLGSSEKFLSMRTAAGLQAFERRFNERQDNMKILEELERFVRTPPLTAELAIGAAHVVGVSVNHQFTATFYELGLTAARGEAVCSDPKLEYDLISALSLPPQNRWSASARAVAEKCWAKLEGAVRANVAREIGQSYYLQNTCQSLIQHNSLKGLLEKRCQAAVKTLTEARK